MDPPEGIGLAMLVATVRRTIVAESKLGLGHFSQLTSDLNHAEHP
jgi:hypothetical protein